MVITLTTSFTARLTACGDATPSRLTDTDAGTDTEADPFSPERYAACEESWYHVEEDVGPPHTWGGDVHPNENQDSFVCNRCPGGRSQWQGTWVQMRAAGPHVDPPCLYAPGCYPPQGWEPHPKLLDLLTTEGELFERRLFDVETSGEWRWRSYHFCGDCPNIVLIGECPSRKGGPSHGESKCVPGASPQPAELAVLIQVVARATLVRAAAVVATGGFSGWTLGELSINDEGSGDTNGPIVGRAPTEILRAPYGDQRLRVGQALSGPVGIFGELDDAPEEIRALSVLHSIGPTDDALNDGEQYDIAPPWAPRTSSWAPRTTAARALA